MRNRLKTKPRKSGEIMSYMRSGYELDKFKTGESVYVYHDGKQVEDYGESFEDSKVLAELIYVILRRETGDEEWSNKILRILAEKLDIDDQLKDGTEPERSMSIIPMEFTTYEVASVLTWEHQNNEILAMTSDGCGLDFDFQNNDIEDITESTKWADYTDLFNFLCDEEEKELKKRAKQQKKLSKGDA